MQSEVQKYISTTDYTTLKNLNGGTISISIPAGTVVAANSVYTSAVSTTCGAAQSSSRALIEYNGASYVCHRLSVMVLPAMFLYGNVFLYKSGDTTMTAVATVFNNSGSSITTTVAANFTIRIQTFLPPFTV